MTGRHTVSDVYCRGCNGRVSANPTREEAEERTEELTF